MKLKLDTNGKAAALEVDDPQMPLLYALRDDLGLRGPRFGCGLAQCGYRINGMIMRAKALLDRNPHPSEAEIKEALAMNLCRCGTHLRIVKAVKRANRSSTRSRSARTPIRSTSARATSRTSAARSCSGACAVSPSGRGARHRKPVATR